MCICCIHTLYYIYGERDKEEREVPKISVS